MTCPRCGHEHDGHALSPGSRSAVCEPCHRTNAPAQDDTQAASAIRPRRRSKRLSKPTHT